MQYSHSRIDFFEKCKFKYKMRYIDEIETVPSTEPDNPLILGTALHTGIEKGVEAGIDEYLMSFPIVDDAHINEAIKLEFQISQARKVLPTGEYEVEIQTDEFHGFIDLLTPAKIFERGVELPNQYDIYDFKYSNNVSHYKESRQLHLYKYYFEKANPGKHIRNLFFVFVPKVQIKQKKDETLTDFRRRLSEELGQTEVKIVPIEYQVEKVIDWLNLVKSAQETTDFPKNPCYLCRYCEYQNFCEKGDSYMLLPKNERRNIAAVTKRVMWIYGVPFCGKTTFANAFPDPLMLNTDGNIKFVDAPYIHIRDEVKVEGRMTKRTQAWEVFEQVVAELEKKENTFKTIVVDLLEDLYESCRVYMCGQMGITHESDDSFKAWDKVRSRFLNTLKRLINLDYENIILISHEDSTKDITKKGGDKVTAIKPNLPDKVANKVAGMVDVVARIVADGDSRTFCFKASEVVFGGGRLKVTAEDIPLDVNALFSVYDQANRNAAKNGTNTPPASTTPTVKANTPTRAENPTEANSEPQEGEKRSRRRAAATEPVTATPEKTTEVIYLRHPESDSTFEIKVGTPVSEVEKMLAEGCVKIDKAEFDKANDNPPWEEAGAKPQASGQAHEEAQPTRRVRKSRSAQ